MSDVCLLSEHLRAMLHRKQKLLDVSPSIHATTSSHTNVMYLSTPLRSKRYKHLKARCDAAEGKVKRLTENINKLIASRSVLVDSGLHQDLTKIMEENQSKIAEDFPENSFQRLSWKQQQQALKVKNNRQLRWHPMMVKWCLHDSSEDGLLGSTPCYAVIWPLSFLLSEHSPGKSSYRNPAQRDVNTQIIKEAKLQGGYS